ncbi:pyridoxamine 5'-phosphate oxidase [Flavobacteriaceae bacterium]|nr:pyridoxamine 5'-phosphate oxidase [Flavobacteriaceae bacterium]
MDKNLSNYRKSYEKAVLLEETISDDPMELFQQWFNEVDLEFPDLETNAMTLSTIGLDGYPKNRVVLLKKYTYKGFIFYTNYESEKGKSISANSNVCLSFHWEKAEKQVIIKGSAIRIAEDQSDEYFESRPKGSQLGAIVSNQSEVIESRGVLEKKLKTLEAAYDNKKILRPKFWGGFLVNPVEVEFWQGRANRLHDRIRYQRQTESSWTTERLSP